MNHTSVDLRRTRRAASCRRAALSVLVFSVMLGPVGCGSSGQRAAASDARSGAARELRHMDALFTRATRAYQSKDDKMALSSALDAREAYESEAVEGVVARVAPPVNRQLDNLVMEQIPGAVKSNVSQTDLQSLIDRAHDLIDQGLQSLGSSR